MATKALVTIQNDQALTTSLKVAEYFDKQHKHVLEAIREILVAEKSATKFFHESTFENRGKNYPIYLMNRDGFSLLAMGFTGKKALKFKLKFIDAFNKMEARLTALTPEEAERLKIRQAGKTNRRTLTDAIKPFVEEERPKSSGLYFAMPTKFIQTELCGIPKGGRDEATGQQLLICAALETAAANTFEQSYHQDKNFYEAFHDAKKTATFLRSVFNGAVPALHRG